MDTADSHQNRRQRDWIQATLVGLFQRILQRGFHGQATLTITVQDGTIQHYKHAVEEHHRPRSGHEADIGNS